MELFYCRGDIIEFLFKIKEQILSFNHQITNDEVDYFYRCIEIHIPASKYLDKDIKELSEEVEEILDDWVYMRTNFFREHDFSRENVVWH